MALGLREREGGRWETAGPWARWDGGGEGVGAVELPGGVNLVEGELPEEVRPHPWGVRRPRQPLPVRRRQPPGVRPVVLQRPHGGPLLSLPPPPVPADYPGSLEAWMRRKCMMEKKTLYLLYSRHGYRAHKNQNLPAKEKC